MNLKLKNMDFREDGIFGILLDENNKQIAVTLQHAYDSGLGDGSYAPKLPNGEYNCIRGMHKLHDLKPFETFKVNGVFGHSGILFHIGNYNKDSDGCILLGHGYGGDPRQLYMSRTTFESFMALQHGVDEFILTVE